MSHPVKDKRWESWLPHSCWQKFQKELYLQQLGYIETVPLSCRSYQNEGFHKGNRNTWLTWLHWIHFCHVFERKQYWSRNFIKCTNDLISIKLVSYRWLILDLAMLSLIDWVVCLTIIRTILSSKNVRHVPIGSTAVWNSDFTTGRFWTMFPEACQTAWVVFSIFQ